MKSVPNFISYLHEFSWNFSQLLPISFELFSFVSIFNSELNLPWGPTCQLLSLHIRPAHQSTVSTWRAMRRAGLPSHDSVATRAPLSEAPEVVASPKPPPV
jgi:hypothetical protein